MLRTGNGGLTLHNGIFRITDPLQFDTDDILILHGILQGLTDQQLASQFNQSLSTFKAKKRYVFAKLHSTNAASAIDQARKMSII